jgi:cytochrome P450
MTESDVFQRILDPAHRADPYPLYTELRRTPIARQANGSYVASTYRTITALLHDPRVSSDRRSPEAKERGTGFINLDPPDHDRLRQLAMKHFGPPTNPGRIDRLRPELTRTVSDLIDAFAGRERVDIVDDFAYPFPVSVICTLLGVPREDQPRFSRWVDELVNRIDPEGDIRNESPETEQALLEFNQYLHDLIDVHRRQPGDDLISAFATDDVEGHMSDNEIVGTSILLLIAGHETTVNLIANGTLTFLRHPDIVKRLQDDPELIIGTLEELLRYEPSVHLVPGRIALDDIELEGVTIPKGAQITLALAAGNRDPEHVADPDTFDPDRSCEHLSFGGGIHFCFGAPLARLEAQIALSQLVTRLENPRLVADPPEYRPSPVLRGPRHLLVEFDGIRPAP